MPETAPLARLVVAIASGDSAAVSASLAATPSLATARLARADEFFVEQCRAQVYAGDTALHAAAFAYDAAVAHDVISLGGEVRARNRRGAEPLHAAVMGAPGNSNWNPERQRAVIMLLIGAGADPNAAAAGGVTALHRAARNRCSGAVATLLQAGADPRATTDRGSTALDIARSTSGRGGVGSEAAKAEQRLVIGFLGDATA